METPIITFAPKAIIAIVKCQQILSEFAFERTQAKDSASIDMLLKTLKDPELISEMKEAGLIKEFGQSL